MKGVVGYCTVDVDREGPLGISVQNTLTVNYNSPILRTERERQDLTLCVREERESRQQTSSSNSKQANKQTSNSKQAIANRQ
jgi:hypothetical protein